MRMLYGLSLVSLVLASAGIARAQSAPPLTSNRPGIGESEALMPRGAMQLESGLSASRSSSDGARTTTISTPEATFRIGLTPRLEVFAGGEGLLWIRQSTDTASVTARGASDLSIDAKVALLAQGDGPLTISIAGGVSLPAGADAFSSGGVDPSVRLLWSRALAREFSIGGNVAIAAVTDGDRRAATSALSAGLGRPLSESTSWFLELFGAIPRGAASTWTLDGGLAIVRGADVQFDVSGGRAVRGPGADWFISAGVTVRHRR
jgi:hypothetical protein